MYEYPRGLGLVLKDKGNSPTRLIRRGTELEQILQCKLNAPSRSYSVSCLTEAGRFKEAVRDSKVRSVRQVKDVCSESQDLTSRHCPFLDHGKVQLQDASRAERVAAYGSVLAEWR